MVRSTEKTKEFIKEHPKHSSRKLAKLIGEELNLKVSHTAIANYRKNLKKESVKIVNFTPVKVKREKRIVEPKFPLSIDQLNNRLQSNKDHYWYEYLNKQLNGRLRSDFQKLLEFIRDTNEKKTFPISRE